MPRESPGSVRVFYPRFNKEEIIQAIRGRLSDLSDRLPLTLIILFGSYAKGNYTVASDVDLLVVYEGRKREEAFATVKRTLDIPRLEPHVYSRTEYEAIRKTINKMIRGGIILFRLEDADKGVTVAV